MFDEQEFIIHVYCVMCEYYKRLFPDGVRERGFEPVFTGSEALTLEIAGEYTGLENDSAVYDYFKRHYSS